MRARAIRGRPRRRFARTIRLRGTEFAWADLGAYAPPPALELHAKLLRFFAQRASSARPRARSRARDPGEKPGRRGPRRLLHLEHRDDRRAGELGAGRARSTSQRDGERFIEVTRDVETTVIKVPAGLQDYYGAMYGGLQSLRWGAGVAFARTLRRKRASRDREPHAALLLGPVAQLRNQQLGAVQRLHRRRPDRARALSRDRARGGRAGERDRDKATGPRPRARSGASGKRGERWRPGSRRRRSIARSRRRRLRWPGRQATAGDRLRATGN